MTYLVFDTETNGIPFTNLPLNNIQQPNIVQLSAILFNSQGKILNEMDTLIKPKNWNIDFEYELVHGWSVDDCEFMGIDISDALLAFDTMCQNADLIIAHHIEFDITMLNIEAEKNKFTNRYWNNLTQFCTMKQTQNICKIPYRGNTYKYPSLNEAIKCLLGEELDPNLQHNAHYDALKTKDLFLEIKNANHLNNFLF